MHRAAWWPAALLVALVLAAYAPVLRNDFLRWDDEDHVYENPRVTEPDGLLRSWYETASPGFYPVTYTTFYFEWRAAGGKPWLFHLDNVLLHAASAVLVWRLCAALALAPTASWFVAALWALHPLQVASVAWIAERKNVLYVFLYLLALLLYLESARAEPDSRRQRVAYVASVVLFACALLSKAAAMTLPAAIVLFAWASGRRLDRAFWLSLVPYGVVAFGAGLALLSSVPADIRTPSLATRLALAPHALWFYASTFVWPRELLPLYPRWPLTPPAPIAYLSWLGLAGLAAAVIVLRNRLPRPVLVGLGFFLLNVSLVIGIAWFTFLGHSPVGDHLSYLPNLGLALAAVAALTKLARAAHLPANALAAGLAAWCAALGVATWRQIPVWHDTETLWNYTLARNPECPLCHYNLGVLFDDRGDPDAAAAHYETAMRIEPDAEAAINLGSLRLQEGRVDEATALYERALQLDRTNPKAHVNLGLVRASQGKTDEAITHYRAALRLAPGSGEAHRGFGEMLLETGRESEARSELEQALRLAPRDAPAALGLARIAVEHDDWQKAAAYYERALGGKQSAATRARTHRELAEVLDELGRGDDALQNYAAAQQLLPGDPEATVDLASALVARHRVGDAIGLLEEAVARTPDAATVAGTLAWIRSTSADARWRDAARAVQLAERASSLTDYREPDLLDTLAAAYAEAGRFPDAVRTARQALAATDADSDLAEGLRERIALYEARKPYRAP